MSVACPHSDADLLELMRANGPMGVAEMAELSQVTPTAIRQRLVRLMAQGLVGREAVRAGRGLASFGRRESRLYWRLSLRRRVGRPSPTRGAGCPIQQKLASRRDWQEP